MALLPAFRSVLAGSLLSAALAAQNSSPLLKLTPPQTKTFTVQAKYAFQVRQYDPPPRPPLLDKQPEFTASAEQTLISMLSAQAAGNFDWWFACWDAPAQSAILARYGSMDDAKKALLPGFKRFSTLEPSIVTWVQTGGYIILAYELIERPSREEFTANNPAAPKQTAPPKKAADLRKETPPPIAFHVGNGTWLATLDLQNDPVFRNFTSGKTEAEEVVR